MAVTFVEVKVSNLEIYLLGATTLEAPGLILDPIHGQLKPLPMLLMGNQRG